MPSNVKITRIGVKCADPDCGKELPIGSNAKLYHSRTGLKFYGLDGCHVQKKMTHEEWMAKKLQQRDHLMQSDLKSFRSIVESVSLTTLSELAVLVVKENKEGSLDDDEADILIEVEKKVDAHPNKRLKQYTWPDFKKAAIEGKYDEVLQESGSEEQGEVSGNEE